MDSESFSNGNEDAPAYGAALPKLWRCRAVADARAMTVTFWDLL